MFNQEAKTIKVTESNIQSICNKLFRHNINSVIIEGGAQTLQLFIDSGIWDEARVFIGKSLFNEGIKAPKLICKSNALTQINDDTLKIYVQN